MPEYLSPGVYVEEVDAGPKPIEGVSTSTAGAVGVTLRGPTTGKPKLVTSFADFVRVFGGYLPEPDPAVVNQWNQDQGGRWWHFPLAVKGFFDNGGRRLFVKRVFASTATPASGALGGGMVAEVTKDAASGAAKLTLRHLLGLETGSTFELRKGDGSTIGGGFAVEGYDPGRGEVTINPVLPEDVKASRGDFVEIHALTADPLSSGQETLRFTAKARGAWGNGLEVRVRPVASGTLNLLPSAAVGGAAVSTTLVSASETGGLWTLEVADVTGLADGDRVQIQGKEYTVSNLSAGPPAKLDISPGVPAGETWTAGTPVRRLRPANTGGAGAVISAWGASRLYPGALVELDNGGDKETFTVDSVDGNEVTVSGGPIAEGYHEGHRLRLIEAEVTVRAVNGGVVEVEEVFSPLRLVDDGSLSYLVNHVNDRSELVSVATGAAFSSSDPAAFPSSPSGAFRVFVDGDDKLGELTVDDFVGADAGPGRRSGILALEDIDEVSLAMVPGVWANTVQGALIQHCELLRDRFAILDPRDDLDIEGIRAFKEAIDSKYAALYYPWVVVRDPSAGREIPVAPSAHMAGIYARTDNERGVHKAPANEIVRGITRFAQDITMREQDLLNPKGINALRFFPGRGNRVWGARTVSSDPAWKYVNVRRLFLFVEESIDEGTQWVVFEPNDEPLWARVRQTVSNFLTTVWRSGALQGATTEEAFFVRCDRTTMTQDDIDNGRLICEIGIAPVKPAEFVIFRIQQKTLENQAG